MSHHLRKVAVIGSGAYGTAVASVAASAGNHVSILTRNKDVEFCINHINRNPTNFTEFKLDPKITATLDFQHAIKDAHIIFSCLPTQVTPAFIDDHIKQIPKDIPYVNCSKGMIVSKEMFLSEYIDSVYKNQLRYCVLSGPSFAEEMVRKYPTLVVIASNDPVAANIVQKEISSNYFRPYTQDDVIGVEIAGALKNVLAIGAGMIEGLGFGVNTVSAFIGLGCREISIFGKRYHANPNTFLGLAGIGDLMLTSFGKLSRNRQFGTRIAKGEKINDIIKSSKGVVEGLPTIEVVIRQIEKHNLDMPITRTIYDLIHNRLTVNDAVDQLFKRKLKKEFNEFGHEHN